MALAVKQRRASARQLPSTRNVSQAGSRDGTKSSQAPSAQPEEGQTFQTEVPFSRECSKAKTYKVGDFSKRGTFLPVLDWAPRSKDLETRFKKLVEDRNMQQIRILLHSGVSPNLRLYPLRRTA